MFFYQLKGELWKLFAKKRTYIGFCMFLLAQLTIILIFRYTNAQHLILNNIRHSGFEAAGYISMLTIATVMVFVLAFSLLPLYVALVGGDFVSKESEDGTLRMILSRPISRVRLLCIKWLSGFIFSCVLVFSLGFFGLLFCAIWFPTTGGLFVMVPEQGLSVFGFSAGLQHYVMAHAFMVTKAFTIMSLAFMFSCFNMKPAAATILALSLAMIDGILVNIPYFHDFRHWFMGYYLNVWEVFFADQIPWWQVWQAFMVMSGLSFTFLVIGITAFQVRDIKS